MLETRNPPGWRPIAASCISATFVNPSIVSAYILDSLLIGPKLAVGRNSRKRRAIYDVGVIPGRGTKFSHRASAKPRSKRADIRASGIGRTGLRRIRDRSVRARRSTLGHPDAFSPGIGARRDEL